MRIIICDDLPQERRRMRELLERTPDLAGSAIAEYASGEALLQAMAEGAQADLIFLDILMGGLDGIAVARQLRSRGWDGQLVFLTITADYAVDGYEVDAQAYLIKPVDAHRFAGLVPKLLSRQRRPRVLLRAGAELHTLSLSDILYAESSNHQVSVHTAHKTIVLRKQLDQLEEELGDRRFLRCHKSYLVNMDHVQSVDDCFVLTGGLRVPIRVRTRSAIIDQYYRYFISDSLEALQEVERRDL